MNNEFLSYLDMLTQLNKDHLKSYLRLRVSVSNKNEQRLFVRSMTILRILTT